MLGPQDFEQAPDPHVRSIEQQPPSERDKIARISDGKITIAPYRGACTQDSIIPPGSLG
jgi:hypothetical protein